MADETHTFIFRYPEIQAIELEYLRMNIRNVEIHARLPTWLETLERGELPMGAGAVVASLIAKLAPAVR